MAHDGWVFLDTAGWIALLNASDRLHGEADSIWRELGRLNRRVLVSDWIIAEAGNGLARTPGRAAFVKAVNVLLTSPRAEVVIVDGQLLSEAVKLYASRGDKTWGLVDCASFIIMERQGIHDVFGNDRHFGQAGFHCLLPVIGS